MSAERPSDDDRAVTALDALLDDLGPLLSDPDVSEVLVADGALRVVRRGAREMLTARVSDAVYGLLQAAAPEHGVTSHARRGHRVHVGPGAHTVRIEAPAAAKSLAALVDGGVMESAAATALDAAVRTGMSHIAHGAHRIGRRDTARALALVAAPAYQTFCAPDETELVARGAMVWPLARDGACDVDASVRLGAEFVYLGESDLDAVRRWLERGVRVIAALGVLTTDNDLPVVWTRVGARSSGAPQLLGAAPEAPAAASTVLAAAAPAVSPVGVVVARPTALLPPTAEAAPELPPLAPLPSGPPAGWATDNDEHAPGWELSTPPGRAPTGDEDDAFAGGDAFRRVMDDVKTRPAYTPQPPPVHPQAARLQQQGQRDAGEDETPDPFGGLTLEPPRTGPGEVE